MNLTALCCLRNCFSGLSYTKLHKEINPITLDTLHMGPDVVIIKNGLRICGRGGALTNAPLVQNKSYFEVKIQEGFIWGIGLATQKTDLDVSFGGMDEESWCLHGTAVLHNYKEIHAITKPEIKEGDIIGVTYDHIELNFYLNGESLNIPVTGIKGTVYPAIYVDEAILDLIVDNFVYLPPMGFEKIMLEQSLL